MIAQIISTLWDCKPPVPKVLCLLQAMSTGTLGTLQDEQAHLKAEYDRMEVRSRFPHSLTLVTDRPASASSRRAALRMRCMDVQSRSPHPLPCAADGPASASSRRAALRMRCMDVQSHSPHPLTCAADGPASASSCRAALRMRRMDVQSRFPHPLTCAADGPPSASALSSSPVHVPPQALPQLLTIVKRRSSQACDEWC